ncbi:helicase DnaB [Anoxybacter fermentans]|uniref:DNA 5'-3' helicase n=1 Tax=Anoxybacter fermentans TaxID=1323375 RepID=A0A3S9T125_9FIRM|nr:DnaB-like helicase C-terminal domain-containing protein [Anoxybacter fermentans]AZR74264.1 helicase DnaB [Anoxybacter fermentans]
MAIEKSELPQKSMELDIHRQEFQILGIILQHPEKIDEIADTLRPHHFSNPRAQMIYEMLLEQYHTDSRLSRTKLYIQLKKQGIVKDPDELIRDLTSGYVALSELEPAVELVKTHYHKNLLLKAAKKIEKIIEKEDLSIDEYQARAQDLIFQATTETVNTNKHIYTMDEALLEAFEAYINRKHNQVDRGLQTGFMSLDKLIGGFKPGHLIVLAASTSMGKTTFALNIAQNVLKRNEPVAIISLEMDAIEIIDRMILAEASVHGWKYSQGETNEEEDQRISKALDRLHGLPLLISDERGLNVSQIRARLRKFKAQLGKLSLVIIDYLQLISLTDVNPNESTARQIGKVVVQLRNLASELGCPIILLSQLSRSFSSRQDKRPILSDLRDSGNIEEVADSVIFIYRHAHTSIAAREKAREEGTENHAEIIVAKARTGSTGSVTLLFEDIYTRFVDPENLSYEGMIPNEE